MVLEKQVFLFTTPLARESARNPNLHLMKSSALIHPVVRPDLDPCKPLYLPILPASLLFITTSLITSLDSLLSYLSLSIPLMVTHTLLTYPSHPLLHLVHHRTHFSLTTRGYASHQSHAHGHFHAHHTHLPSHHLITHPPPFISHSPIPHPLTCMQFMHTIPYHNSQAF